MTIVAGWISGKTVCLLSDTAVTSPRAPSIQESSFGERPLARDGLFVYEGSPKILIFGNVAIALVGNLAAAKRLAEWIAPSLQHPDLRRIVGEAATHQRTASGESFRLLIARSFNGEPELWHFRSTKERVVIASGICTLGSGSELPVFRK